jgi:hypothetical protein
MDRYTAAVEYRLRFIRQYRILWCIEKEITMAIEIKGLKLQAMTARGHLDRLSKAYAKFNEAAPAHASDVEGMASQIGELASDLEFATNLMGNSSAVLGNGQDEPAITAADVGALPAEITPAYNQMQPAQALRQIDLVRPADPPPIIAPAAPNPIMNHAPISRAVPSRREL